MDTPSHISRYEILEVIGQGGMGVVYKAQDPNIGRLVALKVIKPSLASDEEVADMMKERFRREARAAGTLAHPNIITVYDAGEHEGMPFIAMEYVEGRPLDSILEDSPLALAGKAASLVLPLARALDFAHQKGIIHRDVKPANIIVLNDGSAKIMDFGIARLADSDLTQTGSVLGSPNYMSPEQITGQGVDGRTDVFSLGVVLYQMLTGERPFLGENTSSITFKVVRVDPVAPSSINPAIDPAWDAITAKALAKRPDQRYESAGGLARDLELMSEGKTNEIGPPPAPETEGGDTRVIAPPSGQGKQASPDVTNPVHTSAVSRDMPAAGEAGEKPGGSESPVEVRLKDVGTMITRLTGQFARKVKPPLQRKPSRGAAVTGFVVLAAVLFFLFTYEWDPHERAQEYIEEGKHEKAIKTLNAITEDNPQDHQAFFKLGGEYARVGNAEKSLAAYSAALAMDPEYKKSPKMIKALLHLPRGEKAKAGTDFIIEKAGSSSKEVLEEELANPDYNVHWNAYRALERMGTRKDMLPLLILDLKTNPECEIRKQAAEKMGELRDHDALPALEAARDKDRNRQECMGDSIEKAIDKIKSSPKRSSSASGSKDPVKKLEKGLRRIFDR